MRQVAETKRVHKENVKDKEASTRSAPLTAVNEASPAQPRSGRAKRSREESKSESEAQPEYLEEKRNMEELWKAVFLVGTEWDQLDAVYRYNWDFSNLEEALEEGGVLHGKKVYLFGCTEPQMVPYREDLKIICVPAIVAVVSPFPPSDKVGIFSVQYGSEEIVPMKQMKMDWVPYIPMENRDTEVFRLKSQIFILSCTQRRTAVKHMKIARLKKFEYCLPFELLNFYHPLKEDEVEQITKVPMIFQAEDRAVFCEFDWATDELEGFTDTVMKDEALSEDHKDAFMEFVEKEVGEAQKANREAREAKKKAREELSEETKTAFQNMRFYKFYPKKTEDAPDVSSFKSPFISRYYGDAHDLQTMCQDLNKLESTV